MIGMTALPACQPAAVNWRWCRFNDLTVFELHDIYRARQQVFGLEQNCVYLDIDGFDEASFHLAGWTSGERLLLAYARLADPGSKYVEPSMGRVITVASARGTGLGRELVRRVIRHSDEAFPGQGIRISAQARLETFYTEAGFVAVGKPHLEDGIPHIEMFRA